MAETANRIAGLNSFPSRNGEEAAADPAHRLRAVGIAGDRLVAEAVCR